MEVEHAVQVLRKDIHEGRFVPGQRLVESDLMTYLEVTRGRVREVFRRLEAEGLIEISKNRGASVRKISREEVANIAEVLEDISVLIIKKAAKRIDENDNRKMLATSMETAREFREKSTNVMEVAAFMDENARFWGSLAEAAANPILSDIRKRLQSLLFRFAMQGVIIHGDRDKWISWHEDIIVDLLEGNANKAVRHAKRSMSDVWESILSLPDSAFGH
jgi:DNA-binding GntR family transcriptional regulator